MIRTRVTRIEADIGAIADLVGMTESEHKVLQEAFDNAGLFAKCKRLDSTDEHHLTVGGWFVNDAIWRTMCLLLR